MSWTNIDSKYTQKLKVRRSWTPFRVNTLQQTSSCRSNTLMKAEVETSSVIHTGELNGWKFTLLLFFNMFLSSADVSAASPPSSLQDSWAWLKLAGASLHDWWHFNVSAGQQENVFIGFLIQSDDANIKYLYFSSQQHRYRFSLSDLCVSVYDLNIQIRSCQLLSSDGLWFILLLLIFSFQSLLNQMIPPGLSCLVRLLYKRLQQHLTGLIDHRQQRMFLPLHHQTRHKPDSIGICLHLNFDSSFSPRQMTWNKRHNSRCSCLAK